MKRLALTVLVFLAACTQLPAPRPTSDARVSPRPTLPPVVVTSDKCYNVAVSPRLTVTNASCDALIVKVDEYELVARVGQSVTSSSVTVLVSLDGGLTWVVEPE